LFNEKPIDLRVVRPFEAPAAAVFAGWTVSEQLRRWWGPEGFTCPLAEMDVRVGGSSLVCMRAPAEWGGLELFNTWTYRVVEPGRRLEFVLRFTDGQRNVVSPQSLGIPAGVPAEVPHVLTFDELGNGKSTLTITEGGYTSADAVATSKQGLLQTLDKLAKLLAS
jgi:uncharacterized protein YndB with AHSA1/START domain